MNFLRSLVFALALAVLTPPYALIAILCAPLPAHMRYAVITTWATVAMWLIRAILGIRYRVIGRENLPGTAAVVLSKHQSAWETIAFQRIFPPLSYVLKRELLRVPFFGWGLARMPNIAIDRKAGKDALTQVHEQGERLLRAGFWVIIFPEGTRVEPGTTRRYKQGGAWLACKAGVPVVPVAHNAGEFWPRNAFVKRPGEIVVSIGPAVDTTGLSAAEVNRQTEAWIESEMHRLFPQHYRGKKETVAAHSSEEER